MALRHSGKGAARPESWEGQILVPYPVESALSGVRKRVDPDQRLWYRRPFEIASLDHNHRWLLHFGAVDWQTTVWVNGREVGEHTGGYDPFTIDITEAVTAGNNELTVSVWDPTDAGFQPKGKQVLNPGGIMYTAVTGIWQTVWLEQVPRQYIRSLKVVPDIDRSLLLVTVEAPKGLQIALTAAMPARCVRPRRGPRQFPSNSNCPLRNSGRPINLICTICRSS